MTLPAPWFDGTQPCLQTDPEIFFGAEIPEDGHRRDGDGPLIKGEPTAKRICMSCRFRTACLDYAVTHDEHYGIWGGVTEKERKAMRRRNRRGRAA